MKTSVSSYSYHRLLNKGEMDLFQVMDKTKEFGFDAIEFVEFTAPEGKTQLEFAAELRAYAEKIGLGIASYTIGANFLQDDVAAEVARLKGEVDIAAVLGVPVMRHDIFSRYPDSYTGVKTFQAVLPIIAPAIREVSEYAASKGIITMSENHGFIMQDSDRLLQLYTAVGCTNYRSLCDIGNFICADEDNLSAVKVAAPYAFHVHAKDFLRKPADAVAPGNGWFKSRDGQHIRGTIVGHGVVPIPECVAELRKAGYDKWLSLEFEGMEDNLTALKLGLQYLKKVVE